MSVVWIQYVLTWKRFEKSRKGDKNEFSVSRCFAHVSLLLIRAIAWELPPHVPFRANVTLVEMYTSLWERPSIQCFDDILFNSTKFEGPLLEEYFGQYHELLSFVR